VWWRIALLVGLLALALLALSGGLAERLEPSAIGSLLRDSGPWGPAVFVALFSLGNGLGLPGAVFLIPAVAVWPIAEAFLWVWLGAIGAGLVGYGFARTVGRDFVEARLPVRLRDLDARASQRAVRTVALIRLTLFLLAPAHWALGLSSIRLGPYLAGTALGFLPGAAFWTFAGGQLLDAFREPTARGWLLILGLVLLAVFVPRWYVRWRRR
jgi:uncharacterized membrane protein YdjX (TVP38/TMEM64 family)